MVTSAACCAILGQKEVPAMTPLSQQILQSFQVRKTKDQKLRFIELLRSRYPQLQVEEGGIIKSRNIVIGDVKNAKLLLTAHYDTCARLPFPNFVTPKNMAAYLGYQLLIAAPFIALFLGVMFGLEQLGIEPFICLWLGYVTMMAAMVYVLMLGPANKHTANDNTSGVITLIEIMETLTEAEKSQVAFVFFDNEENGLLGSSRFAKDHKKDQLKSKLVLNFDCVSDGDHFLFVLNKPAYQKYAKLFQRSFPESNLKTVTIDPSSKAFYPSDQKNFPVNAAVASMKHHKLLGLYMDKIHTKHDTVFQEENIQFLAEGTARFLQEMK